MPSGTGAAPLPTVQPQNANATSAEISGANLTGEPFGGNEMVLLGRGGPRDG